MTGEERKQYSAQKIYLIDVLHEDLVPFLRKNPKTRSVNIVERNGFLTFYLAGAKHASCVITPKGKMMISYRRIWEHDAILVIVKDAMRQAGYNPGSVKLERYQPAYAELRKPYELFSDGVFSYDMHQVLLRLIPGLKERLEEAGTRKFRVEDAPCLFLGADPVFKEGIDGEIIVHATAEAKEAFYELQKKSVFDEETRRKIEKRIRKRFKSAGLPFKEEWFEE